MALQPPTNGTTGDSRTHGQDAVAGSVVPFVGLVDKALSCFLVFQAVTPLDAPTMASIHLSQLPSFPPINLAQRIVRPITSPPSVAGPAAPRQSPYRWRRQRPSELTAWPVVRWRWAWRCVSGAAIRRGRGSVFRSWLSLQLPYALVQVVARLL